MDLLVVGATPLVLGMSVGALVGHDRAKASYASVKKPSWSPPPAAFGVVWAALYALMGASCVLVYRKRKNNKAADVALYLFAAQLLLNLAWSPIYVGLGARRAALALLLALDALLIATVFAFARVDVTAAWLLAPYVAWLGVATLLNASVVSMNP